MWIFRKLILILLVIGLCGCAGTKRNALPKAYVNKARIPGMAGIRDWGHKPSAVFQRNAVRNLRKNAHRPSLNILALSGGGSNGAYSVGLLNGWTDKGTRPDFVLVTGISTGALIAPFAFIGPRYDKLLKKMYTNIRTKDIANKKSVIWSLLTSDSLYASTPMAKLIAKHVDMNFLNEVAREHEKGKTLLIRTTNLDVRHLMVWNMGAIASRRNKQALQLFRDIMRASASIPAAFPPVMINVEAGGKQYDEMHVDGGVTTEVFFYGHMINLDAALNTLGLPMKPTRLFIMRNNQIDPPYKQVDRKLKAIAGRALSNLTTTQGIGDLYRIYLITERDEIDFNLTYIPSTFKSNTTELFDPVEMKRLYRIGYRSARFGNPWMKLPPGFQQFSN